MRQVRKDVGGAAPQESGDPWTKAPWRRVRTSRFAKHRRNNWKSLVSSLLAVVAAAVVVYVGQLYPFPVEWTIAMAGALLAFALFQLGKFLPDDWFVGFLFCLSVALYFASVAYRSKVDDLSWRTEEVFCLEGTGATSGGTELRLSYPRTIPLEPADKPGWAVSAYLWPGCPHGDANAQPATVVGIPGLAVPGETVTYTVMLTPTLANVLVLTDDKGIPVPPRLVVATTATAEKPAECYVRQALPVTRTFPVTTSLEVNVLNADGEPVLAGNSFEVSLEDSRSAWRRHFWELLLGPTTPLLAFAGAVASLGAWWWQEEHKRRREQEEERLRREREQEEERLRRSKQEVAYPRQIVEKYNSAKDSETRRECLEEAVRELESVRGKYRGDPEVKDEVQRTLESVRRAQLEQIRTTMWLRWHEASEQYKTLKENKEAEGWEDEALLSLFESVGRMLEGLAPRPEPPEAPSVAAWVRNKGLKFNPFGPEKAEDDPHFLERSVPPPGWDIIGKPGPVIIRGAPGSGRTVARLYLMDQCEKQGFATGQGAADTLAFTWEPPLEGPAADAATACARSLAACVAEANLTQLARNPDLFERTPFPQQRALALLFRLTEDAIGDPRVCLEGRGLGENRAEALALQFRRLSRGLKVPQYADQRAMIALLSRARLATFAQHYVCVEIPDDILDEDSIPEARVHLKALGDMMPVVARARIFIKAFVRQASEIDSLFPATVDRATLAWGKDTLGDLLRQRLQSAGAPEDIKGLFGRVKDDLEDALLDAALKSEGAPQRLIRLGNALVKEAAENPPLTWDRAREILGMGKE